VSTFGPIFDGNDTAQDALHALLGALQSRHGDSVVGVLFYGSCLRSGDLHDGLVDLYVIVRSCRAAHRNRLSALANHLLAPNVYYLQAESRGETVRCKYAVVSADGLDRGVSRRWFESYLWGRFCQPVAVAFARDEAALQRMRNALKNAATTFLDRILPCVPEAGTIAQLWEQGLAMSYATELRAEGGKRASTLIALGGSHFAMAITEVQAQLRWPLEIIGANYRTQIPPRSRRICALAWSLRRVQGKILSVLRLLKALFTFEGGFDYIAWKLERHSGQPVHIPERVRKYPLLFVWGLMWRLYRQGILR
jgi:hypothetical protein